MKRILAMLLLSVMGVAYAHPQSDNSQSTTYSSSGNACKSPLYYSDDMTIKVTPDAGPRIAREWNCFLTADFIYWTVRQDGMFYAVSGVGGGASTGKVHDLDWKWEPGFKVGLGFNLPHDGWDLVAEYTWIRSNPTASTKESSTSSLTPYWNVTGYTATTLSKASSSWDIHYNNITLDLGRNAYLSQYMKLRLFAGLQGAWINQDYHARFTEALTGNEGRLSIDQDFWGIGLRAGLNNAFQFTKNFSFFADLSLGLLWGKFDLNREDKVSIAGISGTTLKTGVNPWTEEPVVDLGAGFRYDGWFYDDTFHFSIEAGWEHHLWILHNEIIKTSEPDHAGDLLLQGLTLKARFDF